MQRTNITTPLVRRLNAIGRLRHERKRNHGMRTIFREADQRAVGFVPASLQVCPFLGSIPRASTCDGLPTARRRRQPGLDPERVGRVDHTFRSDEQLEPAHATDVNVDRQWIRLVRHEVARFPELPTISPNCGKQRILPIGIPDTDLRSEAAQTPRQIVDKRRRAGCRTTVTERMNHQTVRRLGIFRPLRVDKASASF